MKKTHTITRRFQGIGLIVAVFATQAVMFFTPRQAHAQWVTANPDLIAQNIQQQLGDEIKENVKASFVASISASLVNLMLYMVNEVAYQSAVWVASGGPGERPLFSREQLTDFMHYSAASIAATAYDNISYEVLQEAGGFLPDLNIRLSDDAEYLAAVRAGIQSTYVRPQLDFDFTSIAENYTGYLAGVYSDDSLTPEEKTTTILLTMSKSFRSNEFSNGLQVYSDVLFASQEGASLQTQENLFNDGFLDLIDPTSGYVSTPASQVREQFYGAFERSQQLPFDIATSSLGSENVLLQVGQYAGSVFTNTLLSELAKKFYSGVFDQLSPTFSSNPFDTDQSSSSRERAQAIYRSIQAFQPVSITDYDIVSQLASCPKTSLTNNRSLYACAIDTSFASVLSRADAGAALTVEEAIDEGYIDGDWALIPSADVSRNQNENCYTYGFCHSNLLKLRKARIIPIGWELAAESSANSSASPVTLNEVIAGFNNCNDAGERDGDHPWCHLIDPNWVLKAPDASCRTLAYGQLLTASGTDRRAEECVDLQSCVSENEDGTCEGGYGYCTREENIWRFRGDECPEQYASCLSFTTRTGVEVDYLRNTLDFAECGEDSIGCTWYATQKKEGVDEVFDWPAVNDVTIANADEDAYDNRIYLTADAEECDGDQAGCSEVIVRADDLDLSLNIVQNASFETDADESGFPDIWLSTNWDDLTYSTDDTMARSGDDGVSPGSGILYQYGLTLNQTRSYAMSFYARQATAAATDSVDVTLLLSDEFGEETIDLTGTSLTGDCSFDDLDGNGAYESITISGTPESTSYERFTCIFTAPTLAFAPAKLHGIIDIFPTNAYIDDIQLEQNEDHTSFHVAYSETNPRTTVIKLAPDYLGCTGGVDDPEACDSFAEICSANDVGCELFTPANGDPAVSGIISEMNQCPMACVGYDTYKQEATRYEPFGEFPLYFIPDTAQSCSEDAVGCDEFTNLTTEEREYYTYLRACVTNEQADSNTNSDQGAVFYTWEGSDEAGYQLREWFLLESNVGAGYNNYGYDTDGDGVDDFVESVPGNAPCSNWVTDEDGISCADDANGDGVLDAQTDACDEHDDIFSNPNCREFYDVNGDIHYREFESTVTVNDSCASYRKTNLAGLGDDNDGDGIDDGVENCEAAGGYIDGATNECRFYGYSEESTACSESENGCRQFTGGSSNNSRVVFEELFETGLTNWDATSAGDVTWSNDSVAADGHSLSGAGGEAAWTFLYDHGSDCESEDGCSSGTGTLGASCTVVDGEQYCGVLENDLYSGKTYTLSFWAKGSGSLNVGFATVDGSVPSIFAAFDESLSIDSQWRQYKVGPLDMNTVDYADFGEGHVLAFEPNGRQTYYIDNIVLREGEENITLIKDSWVTPNSCDTTEDGDYAPQYHLGCQEYTNTSGVTYYLKSFARLCDEDAIGCAAFYKTAESEADNAEIRSGHCSALVDADGDGDIDPVSSTTSCYLLSDGAGNYDTNSPKLCSIFTGDTSCTFDLDFFVPTTLLEGLSTLNHISYEADTTIVPADTDLYAIVSDDDYCSVGYAGCTELGKPMFSQDKSIVASWESVYLINDPDNYDDILCDDGDLFCDEFDAGNAGTFYFKHPLDSTCEYKTDVVVRGETYDGWFYEGTNEFCYGTGSCVDSGISCTTDSDCRENTGSCSVSGLACTNDLDCGAAETCEGVSADTCYTDSGSYLIGGELSGIWRNGDANYTGTVGLCEPQYNGCSEFQDTLDLADDEFYGEADGESYFFIDNARLSENNVLSGSKCNGDVSQSAGCVLFYETGDTGLDYNASATYVVSEHADDFFGGEPFDLVDPINCESGSSVLQTVNGETVDVCAQRCVYDQGYLNDVTDIAGTATAKLRQEEIAADDSLYDLEDIWQVDGSCYVDTDCKPRTSQLGDTVNGRCVTEVDVDGYNGGFIDNGTEEVPRLTNDTNRVMKVQRDRMCAEWLQCASSYTVWDENLGQFREICDSINLCTQYSGSGDSSFCSEWNPDESAVVLDADLYAQRDTSWYGEEYSGYSIPEQFPAQHLSQVNVAAENVCYHLTEEKYYTEYACEVDSDCAAYMSATLSECRPNDQGADYRLAFNAGSCDEAYGESCVVGYCEDDGSACSADDQCGAGVSCVTGQCYSITANTCDADSDCSSGQICSGGFCATDDEEACDIDYSCAGGGTCIASVATKTGTCLREQCVVDPNGTAFNIENDEVAVCRAYPEQDSPWGNEIVDQWVDPADFSSTTSDVDDTTANWLPYSTKPGYSAAELCLPGQDCECSYKEIATTFGQSAYIDVEKDITEFYRGGQTGICLGGNADGALCDVSISGETGTGGGICDSQGGTCYPITSESTFVGLEGYCLERDTGLNIKGDDQGACLTWFPVDQLEGATDLYAKYKQAGFFEDAYTCGFIEMFTDVYTSGLGCVETSEGSRTSCEGTASKCVDNAVCPDGMYALVGQCAESGSDRLGDYSDLCRESVGDNDCPFVCVPENSINTVTGESCDDPTDTAPATVRLSDGAAPSNDVYIIPGSGSRSDFDTVYAWAQNCVLSGIPMSELEDKYDVEEIADGTDGTRGISEDEPMEEVVIAYPACRALVQVADSEEGYAFTDRIYSSKTDSPDYTITDLGYGGNTANPFGTTWTLEELAANWQETRPVRVLSCIDDLDQDGDPYEHCGDDSSCPDPDSYDERSPKSGVRYTEDRYEFETANALRCQGEWPDWLNTDAPEAYSFTDFTANSWTGYTAYSIDEGHDTGGADSDPDVYLEVIETYERGSAASADQGWIADSGEYRITDEHYIDFTSSIATALGYMNEVFAKFIGVWVFDPEGKQVDGANQTYELADGSDTVSEFSEATVDGTYLFEVRDVREDGKPPTVWSVDTDNCYGADCREGSSNAITVNSQDTGDLEGSGGFFRASVKFFAAADKDQLPIRRVIVDWGDESAQSGSSDSDNYYKNRRGLLPDSQSTTFCDTGEEWGMTPDSCDSNYFAYQHNYFCTEGQVLTWPICGSADAPYDESGLPTEPCVTNVGATSYCTYRPAVHVRDNWGWCTGVCTGAAEDGRTDDTDGCYEFSEDTLSSIGMNSITLSTECAYQSPSGIWADYNDPWVYYDGVILVSP